ncbi:ankyrin-3 [Plakobranchus ocellatus]|uniref:Ankyrin-3 n=1 Tax=Plakobranchus ocellatus TaxID=259542 RepID=A0AAV4E1Y1_9GAST|nr:ankyrin-3 [Plakobranchus ocellatus]
MSMRTRIRGMTAWVNLRLMPYNQLMSNVLMDLLSGTGMKYLVESITGRDIRRLDSMDGLSQQQLQTRVEWVVEELKSCEVLPQDVYVDPRMFAMRSADHVFDLLWRLISHDAWFLWERVEYLQHEDQDVITQVPFRELADANWVKFPKSDFMKNFKKKKIEPGKYPPPDACLLEMVNAQLKKTNEGRNLFCYSLDDLVDSRVLCALVNSFVPNMFTSDLLLNDRWTINLALRSAEKMFYAETPFDSEDLVEADGMAVASYFTFFFMVAYKYRQCKIVVERIDWIGRLIRECNHELEKFPPIVSNMQELSRRKELKSEIERHKEEIEKMVRRFDVEYCRRWVEHVQETQLEVRKHIQESIRNRFDFVTIPRNITINDLCLSYVINLSLTNGSGFYLSDAREMLTEGRRLVLRHKESGEFLDDFSSKNKVSIKTILGLPKTDAVEINPMHYPQYEFYYEAPSRNKHLKAGTVFLYQVFPGNYTNWQRTFVRAARENQMETVDKMITFFRSSSDFINAKEPKTGHTALHHAARHGHFDVVRVLLENGASTDSKNNFQCTPIYAAIDGLQRQVAHLLIEWGADMHCKNAKKLTPLEAVKNDEFRQFLADLYEHYSSIVPQIMKGDKALMEKVLHDHSTGKREFCSLRSRCINGSTLLHTACYYGYQEIVKDLLQMRVDVNLQDYKGASPLHRAKDHQTMLILLENGANIGAEDAEGNTCLHVKCYGEIEKPSELDCIELLLSREANPVKRNNRGLLPIHCCAMQGRVDAMRLLLDYDKKDAILKALNNESDRNPPSLLHLAIANDFLNCAEWMMNKGFHFKDKEQDILMRRILTEQIKVTDRAECVRFLLNQGADPNPLYPGGNSSLHYAASLSGPTDILELLLLHGADVDVLNSEGSSPLMFACQANNQFAASVLIAEGANVRQKNVHGLTAFDHIVDFEEWIGSGYFSDEITARLKAYSLKHSRDLIRAISKRVKPMTLPRADPALTLETRSRSSSAANWSKSPMSALSQNSLGSNVVLPAIGGSAR